MYSNPICKKTEIRNLNIQCIKKKELVKSIQILLKFSRSNSMKPVNAIYIVNY